MGVVGSRLRQILGVLTLTTAMLVTVAVTAPAPDRSVFCPTGSAPPGRPLAGETIGERCGRLIPLVCDND
jgi:hypothetical protein